MKIYSQYNAPHRVQVLDPEVITEPDQSKTLLQIITEYTSGFAEVPTNINDLQFDDDDDFSEPFTPDDIFDVLSEAMNNGSEAMSEGSEESTAAETEVANGKKLTNAKEEAQDEGLSNDDK